MKKKLLAPIIAVASYLFLTSSAHAQILDCGAMGVFKKLCEAGTTSISGIVSAFIAFIFFIAIIIAIFYLLWGGVKWITSAGDKAAIEAARGHIIAAIAGLVILFLTFLIFNILLTFFNLNISTLSVPTIP